MAPYRRRLALFLIVVSILAFICGTLWYAVHAEIIIFSVPAFAEFSLQPSDKKKITLFWYTEIEKIEESTEIIYAQSVQENIATTISTWLSYMQEEGRLDKHIKAETVALTSSGAEVFVSFSQTIFDQQLSCIQKWYILESLFATLRPLFSELRSIRLLVNNQPLYDEHIDCATSLPVCSFLQTAAPSSANLSWGGRRTIVIHPAGDKLKTGRIVAREFERKLTRVLAQYLKQILEETGRFIVTLTHEIGQQIDQHESASLANRLRADAYIYLSCCESKKILPEISCYFTLYNPTTDFWHKKRDPLSLLPIDKAYLVNINTSCTLCATITHQLKDHAAQRVFINQTRGLPLAPLQGIQVPSCVIECGIQKPEQIEELAYLIARALTYN